MGAKTNAPPSPAGELEALATELAALTGESVPEAVRAALEERLAGFRAGGPGHGHAPVGRPESADGIRDRVSCVPGRVAGVSDGRAGTGSRKAADRARRIEEMIAGVREIQARVATLPVLDGRSADEILGYDADGLPT